MTTMPIRPEMRDRYPEDWERRSRFVIQYRARNRCEWCGAVNRRPHPITGSPVVLSAAHVYDHRPENASLLNLAALCQLCHNRHDAPVRRAGVHLRWMQRSGQRELDLGVPDSEAMSIARELLLPFAGSKTVVARVDDHRAENANPPSSGAPSRRHRNGNDGPERDPGPYFWRELRGEQLRLDADSGAMKVARAVPEQSNLLKWAVLYYCRRNGDDGLGRGPEPYLAWRPMATQLELNTRQGSA